MSRTGIMGTRFTSSFSIEHGSFLRQGIFRQPGFFEQAPVDFAALHHFRGHDEVAELPLSGQVIHHFEHEVFEDHAQAAGSHFALQREVRNRFERVVGKAQTNVFKFEESLVLTDERVFRFRQDAHQRALIEIAQHAHDRQAAHEFGNQAVADQIGWLRLLQHFDIAPRGGRRLRIGMEARATFAPRGVR